MAATLTFKRTLIMFGVLLGGLPGDLAGVDAGSAGASESWRER